ncbi:hypothetical protein HO173_011781 [Letharia columbiana]|uniref:Uncharacterized protein n=1 Tax=Letharia columbiana TaxID=112416 RepID=A0A8H6CS14_9LECA|nr:uncharacterized protein HO173_011781 [Letharia columbiana]KAF6228610.1 hypothetical protein HO173_011781 [Letharia columbiana]
MLFVNMSKTIITLCKPFRRILAVRKGAGVLVAPANAMTAGNMAFKISRSIEAFGGTVRDATGVILVMGVEMFAV